ncbi:DNA ligase [Nocardioides sp.]|uniref:ATP-dependent DNA ligase n=1 Tax=Nocardioides sp. TaxID=35761 RepID=UPI0039E6E13A
MRPMLAMPGDHVPAGPGWSHEVKWDGVRILASRVSEVLSLTTRNERDATTAWPEVAAVAPAGDLLVDGEIIALGEHGRPDFRALAERIHARGAAARRLSAEIPATYLVFDLLRLDGRDLTGLPLAERREILAGIDLAGWQLPEVYDDGPMLHEATRQQRLEGIVSKRLDSTYRPGERTRAWLKFAHRYRGSYVVGGWRPQVDTTDRLAALLVGEVTDAGLVYRGRVGSGIGPRESAILRRLLVPGERSPFADEVPRPAATGTFWVRPTVVVDVDTHGTGYDRLRQPSYRGVRTDLSPEELG